MGTPISHRWFRSWLLGLAATLNTTSFEPLAWTAVAYALARAAILDDRRAPIVAGCIAGVALEAKYALPLWLVALAIGLLATPQRRVLAYRELWIGVAIAAAVAAERAIRSGMARTVYATAIVALAAAIAPLALPSLPPNVLIAYERTLHVAPQQQERGDAGSILPATFADMLGWHDFVREAAALDLYGRAFGMPPALSGQNQYGLWGPRGQSPANLLRVQNDPQNLRPYCAQMRVIATTSSTYARAFENGKSIVFCSGLQPSLAKLWPDLVFLI